MYRLHIDIPASENQQTALQLSRNIMNDIEKILCENYQGLEINYRVGNDTDRQKSNYLMINENGHVANKKNVINL
jgi:hypothetical protein